jgi:hypothetical protein
VAKGFSYADAAKLLGGQDNSIVAALDRITGGILLGAVPFAPAVLAWFDARAEFARLGGELIRSVSERRSGLNRYSRTQRLEASHAILVVTAFFEVFAEAPLPFAPGEATISRDEQRAIARRAAPEEAGGSARDAAVWALSAWVPLPRPYEAHEAFHVQIERYYRVLTDIVGSFLRGLRVGEQISETRLNEGLVGLPERRPAPRPAVVRTDQRACAGRQLSGRDGGAGG